MNTQVYEEASNWIVRHRDGDLGREEKRRFDEWLRESPAHVRAYLEMSSIWEDVSALDPNLNPGAEELVARARAQDSVVPYLHPTAAPRAVLARVKRRGRWYALAASVALVTLGAWLYSERNTYSTGIGEQRSIVLSDGSTVELNSRSRVRVRFSNAERDVDLLKGQALFQVAKNPARPFVVFSDATSVRAVGTEFDVYQRGAGTTVTVLEGQVAVTPGSAAPQSADKRASDERPDSPPMPVLVSAGEQLLVTQATVTPPKRANVAAATAWTRRSLVFESSSLPEVAEEFNRYNSRPLVIQDPAQLADFHVSGVFSSVEPGLLLQFLRTQPEIVVEETDKEIRISKK
jgi:transmembrane sensor